MGDPLIPATTLTNTGDPSAALYDAMQQGQGAPAYAQGGGDPQAHLASLLAGNQSPWAAGGYPEPQMSLGAPAKTAEAQLQQTQPRSGSSLVDQLKAFQSTPSVNTTYAPTASRASPTAQQNATPARGMGDLRSSDAERGLDAPGSSAPPLVPGALPVSMQPQSPYVMAPPKAMGGTGGSGGAGMGSASKEADAAFKQQAAAIDAQKNVEIAKAQAQADLAKQQGDILAQSQIRDATRQNAQQQAYDSIMKEHVNGLADFNKISTTVDPNRYWANKGLGGTIAARLGIALGAFGSGLNHQPNQALAMIQSDIDRDIDAQKQTIQGNLDKGKQRISNNVNWLAINRDKFKDDQLAEEHTRALGLQQASNQLDGTLAKVQGNQGAQAAGQALQAELKQKMAESHQRIAQMAQENALKRGELQVKQAEAAGKLLAEQRAAKGDPADSLKTYVPGYGHAVSEDSAKHLRTAGASFDTYNGLLDKAIGLRKEYGSETLPGEAKKKMESLGAQLIVATKDNEGLTRVSPETVELIKKMQGGDLTAYGQVLPALEELKKNAGAGFTSQLKHHLMPGARPLFGEGGAAATQPAATSANPYGTVLR